MDDAESSAAAASPTMGVSALASLATWAIEAHRFALALDCERFGRDSPSGFSRTVLIRVGELVVFRKYPCRAVLCLAESDEDRLTQLGAVLAVGSRAVWPASPDCSLLLAQLPHSVSRWVDQVEDWTNAKEDFDAVLHHGEEDDLQRVLTKISQSGIRILGLQSVLPGSVDIRLDVLVVERFSGIEYAPARTIRSE